MEISELITVMQEELEEVPPLSITPESAFRSLEGWSSMMALILMARFDTEWGITLSAAALAKAVTVQDLYNALNVNL